MRTTVDLPPAVHRRALELARRGRPEPYEKVLSEMESRDRDDATRADSPLTLDDRYVLHATEAATVHLAVAARSEGLTPEAVVESLAKRVAQGPPEASPAG